MNIRCCDNISQVKAIFNLLHDGIISEDDIDSIQNDTEINYRKRRDAEVLTTIAANIKGNCLDIGTSFGRSAYKMATNINSNNTVFSVNILAEQFESNKNAEFITHLLTKEQIGSYYRSKKINNIKQYYADTTNWLVPKEINNISMIYIDGGHDKHIVYSDSILSYKLIENGGFIIWHDFSPEYRNKFEWINDCMLGVELFLDEYNINSEIIHLKNSWTGILKINKLHNSIITLDSANKTEHTEIVINTDIDRYYNKTNKNYKNIRIGLVLDYSFHKENRWVSALTSKLFNSLINNFDCKIIGNQYDYENIIDEVDCIISAEPGWAAPKLSYNRTKGLKEKFNNIASYVFYSDPHDNLWREKYFLENEIDYILGYYYHPTLYHFKNIHKSQLIYFPWAIPDEWINNKEIVFHNNTKITIFGASNHEAYRIRNWCRSFPFVESFNNSGVENKVKSDKEYFEWLANLDAAIAAGSDAHKYRLTLPKYFEIASAGALLFAQYTDDMFLCGFEHNKNCLVFNKNNFVDLANLYLENPENYLKIRHKGRELIKTKHLISNRIEFLYNHINKTLNQKNKNITLIDIMDAKTNEIKIDEEFESWFKKICIPSFLIKSEDEPLYSNNQQLDWEVCHEIYCYHGYSQNSLSIDDIMFNSIHRYELINKYWDSSSLNKDKIQEFYINSYNVLPWGHGVFVADNNHYERRQNWLRRVSILNYLKKADAKTILDYGAGGGHTSLLAKSMGFEKVFHHEFPCFHPYVLWRAGFIQSKYDNGNYCEFYTTDASRDLKLIEKVDAVICSDVAEHVFNPEKMLDDIANSLKDEGILIWVSMFEENIPGHINSFYCNYEEELLERHGFFKIDELDVEYQGYSGIFQLDKSKSYYSNDNNELFKNESDLYLASADRIDKTLANISILEKAHLDIIDTYCTVIGGLSGLNYLLCINPKKIIFFDINPVAIDYCIMIIELIKISNTHIDFISNVFGRSVNKFTKKNSFSSLTVDNQEIYLNSIVESDIVINTLSKLSEKSQQAYRKYLFPHFFGYTLPGKLNCRLLLPCWNTNERVPVGGGEALGLNEANELVPNTNTFFFGVAWLKDVDSFLKIKNSLINANIEYQFFDLINNNIDEILNFKENVALHYSNIDDWFPTEMNNCINNWAYKISDNNSFWVFISSMNGINYVKPEPHFFAYQAILPYIDGKVVEVTHKVPWGFHEFERDNISVDEYLNQTYSADTIILHILVGEGISIEKFDLVLKKAINEAKKILILEHNSNSLDWNNSPNNNYLSKVDLESIISKNLMDYHFKIDFHYIHGDIDNKRNMLFVLEQDKSFLQTKGKKKKNDTETKHKILIFYDEVGWAWWHKSHQIQKNISPEFEITIKRYSEEINHQEFELVLVFESNMLNHIKSYIPQEKIIVGNCNPAFFDEAINTYKRGNFKAFFINNLEYFEIIKHLPNTFCCQNGVDEELFLPKEISTYSNTACWVGNPDGIANKGLDIIEYACLLSDTELVIAAKNALKQPSSEIIKHQNIRDDYYYKAAFYICASEKEGTPNPALEALACGLPVITTRVGNMPEVIIDGYNGFFVDRNSMSIADAIQRMSFADYQELSKNARNSILNGWRWKDKVKNYENMFRNCLIIDDNKPKINIDKKQEAEAKILVLSQFHHISGGTERLAFDIANNLAAKNLKVELAFMRVDDLANQTININKNPFLNITIINPSDYNLLKQIVFNNNIKTIILLADISRQIIVDLLNLGFHNIKKILYLNLNNFHYQELGKDIIYKNSIASILRNYDNVIAMYEKSLAAQFLKEINIDYQVIHNGVPDVFALTQKDNYFRKLLNIPVDYKILVYPAMITSQKNQIGLMKVANKIKSKVKIIFAGSTPDFSDYGLEFKIELSKNPVFIYLRNLNREDIAELLVEADICVFPSLSEGAPLTLLESMACYTPWLADNNVEFAKMLKGGIVANYKNFPEIIDDLLSNSHKLKQLANEGRIQFENEFNITKTADKFIDIINNKPFINKINTVFSNIKNAANNNLLKSNELDNYIDRIDSNIVFFKDIIWKNISYSKQNNSILFNEIQATELFIKLQNTIPEFYFFVGGAGDALLTLSIFYDKHPESNLVIVPNFTDSMLSLLKAFPKLKNIYIIPRPDEYIYQFFIKNLFSRLPNCKTMGITPILSYENEWHKNVNIFDKYKVIEHPNWAKSFVCEKIVNPQIVIAPKGSTWGMPEGKRNVINPEYWNSLIALLNKDGFCPIIIGTPSEKEMYPAILNSIDKRSLSFVEQMKLLASSDLVIAADSWHKTFSALAGVPTIVFRAISEGIAKQIEDVSENVFLYPWQDIRVVNNYNEFVNIYNNIKNSLNNNKKNSNATICSTLNNIKNEQDRILEQNIYKQPGSNVFTSFSPYFWNRDYQNAKYILIKCPPAIGDSLAISAVIKNIKNQYQNIIIYIAGEDYLEQIFKYNKNVFQYINVNSPELNSIISKVSFIIDYTNIIGKLIDYYNRLSYMDIFGNIAGIKFIDRKIDYKVTEQETAFAQKELIEWKKPSKIIGIQLATNKDIKRSYPYAKQLIKHLHILDSNMKFISFGSEEFAESNQYLYDCAKRNVSLRNQIALASMCDGFLTIDSAFFHIGHNLFTKPTLVITGVTNPVLIGNISQAFHYIRNEELNCLNCYWQKKCNIECMNNLSPELIANKFLQIFYEK